MKEGTGRNRKGTGEGMGEGPEKMMQETEGMGEGSVSAGQHQL